MESTLNGENSKKIAVILITLNEEHNIKEVCENLSGWANEIFIVDSYSKDNTVGLALGHGVHVVQRRFNGFGDQWNFALKELPISSGWVMKLDPDERLSDSLKENITKSINANQFDALSFKRRLWFMHQPLPVHQKLIRVWRNGLCKFTDVSVNEHPVIDGTIKYIDGDLEHYDSPDLDHWLEKQNRYTTSEAIAAYKKSGLADEAILFGTPLQRRMWAKKHFYKLPYRYFILFIYHWVFQGAFKAGKPGFIWARLRVEVMRLVEYKKYEMSISKKIPNKRYYGSSGEADERVKGYK
jgi:glycosyltransferase involved in cell wall biosynthesis